MIYEKIKTCIWIREMKKVLGQTVHDFLIFEMRSNNKKIIWWSIWYEAAKNYSVLFSCQKTYKRKMLQYMYFIHIKNKIYIGYPIMWSWTNLWKSRAREYLIKLSIKYHMVWMEYILNKFLVNQSSELQYIDSFEILFYILHIMILK